MNKTFAKATLLIALALTVSASTYAQRGKTKIEGDRYEWKDKGDKRKLKGDDHEVKYKDDKTKIKGDDYEVKVKDDKLKMKGEGFDIKEKGDWREYNGQDELVERRSVTIKEGETTTIVKPARVQLQAPVVAKRTYKAKPCPCDTKTAARKPAAKKTTVAYRPKAKPAPRVAKAPAVLHDTVFATRVDTVFSVIEVNRFAGYSAPSPMMDDFEKLKIKKDDDEIKIEKKYKDGRKVEMKFENEEDYDTYMKWKYE